MTDDARKRAAQAIKDKAIEATAVLYDDRVYYALAEAALEVADARIAELADAARAVLDWLNVPSHAVYSDFAVAANALRAVLDDHPPADVRPTDDDLAYRAWTIIANAHGGRWEEASSEWRAAAERWRDAFHAQLGRAVPSEETPNA